LDQRYQVMEVASLPVHASARPAAGEDVLRHGDIVRESPDHFTPGDALQLPVAGHAPGEGPGGAEQVEAAQHLDKLTTRLRLSQAIASSDFLSLEQPAISSKEDPLFSSRDRG
jgi:hypothetical protein